MRTVDEDLERARRARVRRATRALNAAYDERNAAVRDAAESGLSLRAIAGEAGLTHQGVAKIVRREVLP